MEANNTSIIKIPALSKICIPCLVCGEGIEAEYIGNYARICEKCKKAILRMRKEMESE